MNKKVGTALGIGCGVVIAVVVAMVVAVAYFVPKAIQWGQDQMALEQERQQLANQWNPPAADAVPEDFFPQTVAGINRTAVDTEAAIPEIKIDLAGWHAVYGSGSGKFDVYAYQVTHLEKEALFGRIDDVYENQTNGVKAKMNFGYRMYYSSSEHGEFHLWWISGWLLVFHADGAEDQEAFVKDFLKVSSADSRPSNAITTESEG